MSGFRKLTACLSCLLAALAPLWPDALFLTVPIEGYHQSMGNAGVASVQGAAAMRYNPAGLGLTGRNELQLTHMVLGNYMNGDSVMYSYAFAPHFSAGVFGSALYLNQGIRQVTDFIDTDNMLSMLNAEFGVSAGYELFPNFAVGSTLRYFRLQLGPQVSQSFGGDLGVQYRFNLPLQKAGYRQFSAGLAVRNIGPDFDFYGGGEKERQPLSLRSGLSYEPIYWLRGSADYGYSLIESHSYHFGAQFFPYFYISPRAGIQVDFSGISYTLGGSLSLGNEQNRFSALIGASLGDGPNGGDILISLLYQQSAFATSRPDNRRLSESVPTNTENIEIKYEPYRLVPFRSSYRAEKLQALTLTRQETAGYRQITRRLRRVALQPEDEIHLQNLERRGQREIILTGRKMGLWLNLESLPSEDTYGYWDAFSTTVEAGGKLSTMLGKNLHTLNENINAPLKVEWRLDVRYVETPNSREIRTSLFELYQGTLVAAKNISFSSGEDSFLYWQELAEFYADYFSTIDSYYLLRISL